MRPNSVLASSSWRAADTALLSLIFQIPHTILAVFSLVSFSSVGFAARSRSSSSSLAATTMYVLYIYYIVLTTTT